MPLKCYYKEDIQMNAIILAAGHGTRMVASKQFIHKPLLPIHGIPNIERTIIMLKDYGIHDIVIISGMYAEHYSYLHEKYNCLIVSDSSASLSTLYGVYSIKDKIGDTFIIEGDVVLAENIFTYRPYSFYYVIKYPNCESDAWKPITDSNGRIISFKIGCFKEPCIFGVSFWSIHDAKCIKNFINHISTPENLCNSNKFWDDYLEDVIDDFPIFTVEISPDSATEMNDANEYNFAQKLCYSYYLNPNKYFLNLRNYDIDISFFVNSEQAIYYTKELLSDYNLKHPNNIQDINIPITFSSNEYTYIIKKGDNIIGFIDLVLETTYLLLRRIYIDRNYRNQSLGTIVVNKLISFSKLINKELRVNVYDSYAARFYERLGFKQNFINYILRSE